MENGTRPSGCGVLVAHKTSLAQKQKSLVQPPSMAEATATPPTHMNEQQQHDEKQKTASPARPYFLDPVRFYLQKFAIYETKARWYVIGSNSAKTRYRVMKIDRTALTELNAIEDSLEYTYHEIQDLLSMIDNANTHNGGIKKVGAGYGILGFIRFLKGYYMLVITKRKQIGVIGTHKIYAIEATQDFYIPHASFMDKRPTGQQAEYDEEKYRSMFLRFDLTKDFYFSYTYDLTNSLQYNMSRRRDQQEVAGVTAPPYNDMFVWNHHLLGPLKDVSTSAVNYWLTPIIHGSFVQNKIDAFGSNMQLTVVARRSRLFAGARFLKRGINEQGQCANDVETEQILSIPSMGEQSDAQFTSFVQHRGSIPLYWAQINGGVMPKPPIVIQRVDPFYSAVILHVMDLFKRYGSPAIILNLVRSKEKSPREMILREGFAEAVNFVNSTIKDDKHKIIYIAWDFKKAAKRNKSKLQKDMFGIAQISLGRVGYFHSGRQLHRNRVREQETSVEVGGEQYPQDTFIGRKQCGVVRTNCIDSIDRTNAAQYMVGLCALGHQLYAMGLIDSPDSISFDSGIALMLMDMYEMAGHQLALQYGGSGLAHTMNTFNTKSIVDHSKDFWTTVQRYYSNTFTDQEKQNSINLFLGVFKPYNSPKDTIWSLETDYFLHMTEPMRDLIYLARWWEEPLNLFNGKATSRYNHIAARAHGRADSYAVRILRDADNEDVSDNGGVDGHRYPDHHRVNTFEDFHQTYKLSQFDKLLAQPHRSLKRVALVKRQKKATAPNSDKLPRQQPTSHYSSLNQPASAPPSPTSAAQSSGLGGIMRWLWSPKGMEPKSNEKIPVRRESSAGYYGSGPRNPLDIYGMSIEESNSDMLLFEKYTNVAKVSHRMRKRRKRYADYRTYVNTTHHSAPTIYKLADAVNAPTMEFYASYVDTFEKLTYQPSEDTKTFYQSSMSMMYS